MQVVAHRPRVALSEVEASCLPLMYDVNRLSEHFGDSREAILLVVKQLAEEWYGVECPSNSSEVGFSASNGSQMVQSANKDTVASLRRREAQSDAGKQPSGNGFTNSSRKPLSRGNEAKGFGFASLAASNRDHPAVDMAVIPNRVSLGESYSYPPRVQFCSQMSVESLLYNLRFNAVKPRFVNIPEIPEEQRTKENVMAHLESLAEKGVVYLPAACTHHNTTGKCQGHPTNGGGR